METKKNDDLKQIVKQKYGEIALAANKKAGCGCGCFDKAELPGTFGYTIFSENYDQLKGYNPDADLGLGCGLPTEFARIKKGDTVIDLGSGAGNDCFIARAITGEQGHIIGIDFTEPMIKKARENVEKLEYKNVEFRFGDIEKLPVENNTADVIVSNCVLNLVPDKQKAFAEIFRIMKPGGHFSISDVVLAGELHPKLQQSAEVYAGCVAGALQKQDYLNIISEAGFVNVVIDKERKITIPDEVLLSLISAEEVDQFKNSGTGIYSINVYGEKAK